MFGGIVIYIYCIKYFGINNKCVGNRSVSVYDKNIR